MLYPTVFIIFFAFVNVIFTQDECVSKCPKDCNNTLYQPVCGQSKTNCSDLRTFDNDCDLMRTNCQEKGGWIKIYNTSCEDKGCNTSCTYEYKPVCGNNGTNNTTYPNECIMDRDNCLYGYNYKKISDGECENGSCYENYYDPICAYAPGLPRKTFQSECDMNTYNRNNTGKCDAYNYTKIRDGECELSGLCADCLSTYKPRCACNGTTCRTFNDPCEQINYNQCFGTDQSRSFPFITVFDGTCDGTGCPEQCSSAFVNVPACGDNTTNFRRFDTECELVDYNCKKSEDECYYQKVPCPDDTSAQPS